jgi:hypothetical protein
MEDWIFKSTPPENEVRHSVVNFDILHLYGAGKELYLKMSRQNISLGLNANQCMLCRTYL